MKKSTIIGMTSITIILVVATLLSLSTLNFNKTDVENDLNNKSEVEDIMESVTNIKVSINNKEYKKQTESIMQLLKIMKLQKLLQVYYHKNLIWKN